MRQWCVQNFTLYKSISHERTAGADSVVPVLFYICKFSNRTLPQTHMIGRHVLVGCCVCKKIMGITKPIQYTTETKNRTTKLGVCHQTLRDMPLIVHRIFGTTSWVVFSPFVLAKPGREYTPVLYGKFCEKIVQKLKPSPLITSTAQKGVAQIVHRARPSRMFSPSQCRHTRTQDDSRLQTYSRWLILGKRVICTEANV